MESIVRYILQSYFGDYVDGFDRSIDCSKLPVTLRDLRIKPSKIMEDVEDSAFEFTQGKIGCVQVQMSWRGKLEVVASDIRLDFDFFPLKAMKKAIMPEKNEKEDEEDDMENQVPLDVQTRMAATVAALGLPARNPLQPTQPQQQQQPQQSHGLPPSGAPPRPMPPRFCTRHDASEKRIKGDPHYFECHSCKMMIQTNYAESALCPQCSENERRCMCCGGEALNPTPAATSGARGLGNSQAPPNVPAPQPVFCTSHSTSEQRPKVEPQLRECRNCQLRLQTNYAEFALCPGCSQQERRCMICSASASHGSCCENGRDGLSGNGECARDRRPSELPTPPFRSSSAGGRPQPSASKLNSDGGGYGPPPPQDHFDRRRSNFPRDVSADRDTHSVGLGPSPPLGKGMRRHSSTSALHTSQRPPSPPRDSTDWSRGSKRPSTPPRGNRTPIAGGGTPNHPSSGGCLLAPSMAGPQLGGIPPVAPHLETNGQSFSHWKQHLGGGAPLDGVPPQWMPRRGSKDARATSDQQSH